MILIKETKYCLKPEKGIMVLPKENTAVSVANDK